MAEELTYNYLDPSSQEFRVFDEIYRESFAEVDRPVSMQKMVEMCKTHEGSYALGVYDDGNPIGIVNFQEFDRFIYLIYFAVNNKIRSKGYGSRIVRDMIARFSDKDIIGFGEIENKNEDKSAQNTARRKFYERNGIRYSDYSYWENNERFAIMTSGDFEAVPSHIRTMLDEMSNIMPPEEVEGLSKVAAQ